MSRRILLFISALVLLRAAYPSILPAQARASKAQKWQERRSPSANLIMAEVWHTQSSQSPWKADGISQLQMAVHACNNDAARLLAYSLKSASSHSRATHDDKQLQSEQVTQGFRDGDMQTRNLPNSIAGHASARETFVSASAPQDGDEITHRKDGSRDSANFSGGLALEKLLPIKIGSFPNSGMLLKNGHWLDTSSLDSGVLAAVDVDGPTQNPEAGLEFRPNYHSYYVKLQVGNPHQTAVLLIDSGSDLLWLQCQSCSSCRNQSLLYDPQASSSHLLLQCSSNYCLPPPGETHPMCTKNGHLCIFHQGYYDHGVAADGVMAGEIFLFNDTNLFGVFFGCAFRSHFQAINGAAVNTSGGILGLAGGPLGLPSQLQKPFFFCLPLNLYHSGMVNTPGFLGFGTLEDMEDLLPESIYISLYRSSFYKSFYYAPVVGISIDGKPVHFWSLDIVLQKDGTSGFIIDTGTSFTRLLPRAYDRFRDAFIEAATYRTLELVSTPQHMFDTCFKHHFTFDFDIVPNVVFHFEGGEIWRLHPYNILFPIGNDMHCLAFQPDTQKRLEFNIIGNHQLAGTFIAIDPAASSIVLAPYPEC